MARVEFQGNVIDEPVRDGAFLVVWWRVPPPHDWPRVTAFKIDGRWIDHDEYALLKSVADSISDS